MKIIIAKSFLTKYKKIISLIDLSKLCTKISQNNLISLKHPYIKLKLYIGGLAIRGILLKTTGGNLIFLVLCFKKDKTCGDNLTFNLYKEEITSMESRVLADIENGNYEIF